MFSSIGSIKANSKNILQIKKLKVCHKKTFQDFFINFIEQPLIQINRIKSCTQ
jgi:hypothetical protein